MLSNIARACVPASSSRQIWYENCAQECSAGLPSEFHASLASKSACLVCGWTLRGHFVALRASPAACLHVHCKLSCSVSAAFAGMKTIAKNPLSWPKKIRPKLHKAANKVNKPAQLEIMHTFGKLFAAADVSHGLRNAHQCASTQGKILLNIDDQQESHRVDL